MANRRRAISEAQDQVASKRPDPVSNVAPPSPPAETPSPPAVPVTQDQFSTLVQQVQALTHLVQERLEAPRPAAPAPHLLEEAAAPPSPATFSSGTHGVADPPHRPKEARPVPQGGYGKDLPRSQLARSLSPVFSSHDSTPSPRSPRPAPPAMPEEEIRRQLQEMRQELDAVRQAPLSQPNAERGIPFSERIMREVISPHIKLFTKGHLLSLRSGSQVNRRKHLMVQKWS